MYFRVIISKLSILAPMLFFFMFQGYAQSKVLCNWQAFQERQALTARANFTVFSEFDLTGQKESSSGTLVIVSPTVFVWRIVKNPYVFLYHGDGEMLRYSQFHQKKKKTIKSRNHDLKETWIKTFAELILKGEISGFKVNHKLQKNNLCLSQWTYHESLEKKGVQSSIPPFVEIRMEWRDQKPPSINHLTLKEHLGSTYQIQFLDLQWKSRYSMKQLKDLKFVLNTFR